MSERSSVHENLITILCSIICDQDPNKALITLHVQVQHSYNITTDKTCIQRHVQLSHKQRYHEIQEIEREDDNVIKSVRVEHFEAH